jgi:hypothetical protein
MPQRRRKLLLIVLGQTLVQAVLVGIHRVIVEVLEFENIGVDILKVIGIDIVAPIAM